MSLMNDGTQHLERLYIKPCVTNIICKNTSEAVSIPTKVCNKPLLNQNVPQCVGILNKTKQ